MPTEQTGASNSRLASMDLPGGGGFTCTKVNFQKTAERNRQWPLQVAGEQQGSSRGSRLSFGSETNCPGTPSHLSCGRNHIWLSTLHFGILTDHEISTVLADLSGREDLEPLPLENTFTSNVVRFRTLETKNNNHPQVS